MENSEGQWEQQPVIHQPDSWVTAFTSPRTYNHQRKERVWEQERERERKRLSSRKHTTGVGHHLPGSPLLPILPRFPGGPVKTHRQSSKSSKSAEQGRGENNGASLMVSLLLLYVLCLALSLCVLAKGLNVCM